ncbi:hypothetical protein [Sulfurovum mangrovi]|uniref:hypothetical protein n=1 Tax=Sulfurovum mangrovi TaxID=2893889 RepID=UPI001E2C5087|nr:hypothetical protein [Sulfurovum mangrovi]UFH58121.1 hypothetical protein LN246_07125 [Sulfurovum mangrovi]
MKRIKNFFNGSGRKSTQKTSNRPSREKLQKPVKVLTAFDISERLGIDRRKLEKTFVELGWTEKSARGVIATKAGISNGAQIRYHDMTKNNYVVWDENILDNHTLKALL